MINNRKFWSWAGKLALVAIPAAISGYTSYLKSKVEAETSAKASYEALRAAVNEMHEDVQSLQKENDDLEAKVAKLEASKPVMVGAFPAPKSLLPLMPSDGGVPLAGLGLGAGTGSGGGIRRPPHKTMDAELPERFEDVVQQFKAKK